MAEQSTRRPIGAAMWGGRRPEDVGEPRAIHPVAENELPPEPERSGVSPAALRSVVSLTLVVIAMVLISVGAGLLFGVGAALIGGGLVILGVGIMLGMGDDT